MAEDAPAAFPEIVGVVPMAGQSTRLGRIPFSKEIYPLATETPGRARGVKVACEFLLDGMRAAGIRKAYLVLRSGKWDIPAWLGDGNAVDMSLAYVALESSPDVPTTLDAAYPFVADAIVATGFPDILFRPPEALTYLVGRIRESAADVVLGVMPADRPEKADLIDFDPHGRIRGFVVKSGEASLPYTWILALWRPSFSKFMHDYLRGPDQAAQQAGRELYLSQVIWAALLAGLQVEPVFIPDASFVDIGTPDDLVRGLTTINK